MLKKVLDAVSNSCFEDSTSFEEILYASNVAYKKLTHNKCKHRVIIRIVGQSGSGKTTTLYNPIISSLKEKGIFPVELGVRFFAQFHPNYENLLKQFGKKEIREKTNGFALKCLILTLYRILKDGYFVVLDLTFLMKDFEKYLYSLIEEFSYKVKYNIIALNKKYSNHFISIRQKSYGFESGRVIYKKSINFFNKNLYLSFKLLSKLDKKNEVKIWCDFCLNPFCFSSLKDAQNCYKSLAKIKDRKLLSFENILNSRLKHFKELDFFL